MTARVCVRWVLAPMLLGAALGAWGIEPAHARRCSFGSYWSLEGLTLSPAEGTAEEAALWPDRGQLYPGRLELWGVPSDAAGLTETTVYLSVRYTP